MNITITLTNPGTDTGPFNIYTNIDNYTVPIATSISRATLVGAGYAATVDGNTTTIKVQSTGTCTSSIFLPITQPTTTTTTSTAAPTTTSTTTVGPTTTTSTTATPTTTTTTTSPPGSTTTTTTTPAPNYKFYFEVRNQTDTNFGNGTFFLNPTGGSNTFTTNYSLIRSGISQFNPSGSSFVSEAGYVIDKIVRYNYNGTEAYSLLVGSPNYTFGTGPFMMDSIGVADGFYQTIKVFTKPA
jgi:hypothetical protein